MFSFDPQSYPSTPGVYLFYGPGEEVLYVGKAKNLRRRLTSYTLHTKRLPLKTVAMLRRAKGLETISTATEKEALLLEASLIKNHRPKYNIVLRDDKNYLLFCIDRNHPYPSLHIVRRVGKKKNITYFGPYTSAVAARQTKKIIDRIFMLRKCRDSVFTNRVRPCLQYHIGRCWAPCCRAVSQEDYLGMVRQVELFLSGKSSELLAGLRQQMQEASDALEFERAAQLRDQVRAIQATVEIQHVVEPAPSAQDADVWGAFSGGHGLTVAVLFVRQGRVLGSSRFVVAGTQLGAVLPAALTQFYSGGRLVPDQIITPQPVERALAEALGEWAGHPVRIRPPRGEWERGLMRLAQTNAENLPPKVHSPQWEAVLGHPVRRVEGVDISHLHGQGMRAGWVVFEDGEPLPQAFRHYPLEAVDGSGDDIAAMHWAAQRRLEAGPPWPDLVVVDGGAAQLAAVWQVLGGLGFSVLGIAKGPSRRAGELEDRVYAPGRKNPLALKPGSPELLFLQRVRDSAHRFAVTRQREGRRRLLVSDLESLPGVGPKTAALLRSKYPRLADLAQATAEDLAALGLPAHRIRQIQAALQERESAS
jgi:excinuclease ABC subunit C